MNLKIENVGIIKHADVKLNGLTVIAGENDSGKSTVGKLIFSIVKAVSRYEQILNEDKSDKVKRMIEDIYVLVRNIESGISQQFHPNIFHSELMVFGLSNAHLSDFNKKDLDKVFSSKINIITLSNSKGLNSRVLPKLEDLRKYVINGENKKDLILKALQQIIFSEFYNELTPKNFAKFSSNIQLIEGNSSTFQFSIENNKINELFTDEVLFFNDATFIESPIVLQMYDMINSAITSLELSENNKVERINNFSKAKVSLHLKDLISKLKGADSLFTNESHRYLLDKIFQIIEGNFSFKEKEQDFSFTTKNGASIKSANTASGIKAFGIIQLLIQAGVIDSRSLLIIDEPETHLHPAWQVDYARIIVELVKNNISVLVTSHSPYLIQALKAFSDKENLESKTTFYLSEKGLDDRLSFLGTVVSAEIHDVTHNLNRLFSKLADPLRELL